MRQDASSDRRPCPHGHQKRQIRQRRKECTVEQITCISDEDLLQYLQSGKTCGVEDLSRSKCLDVLRRRHLDVSDDVQENTDRESFQTAEDIGDLCHWRFDDGYATVSRDLVSPTVDVFWLSWLLEHTVDNPLDHQDGRHQGMGVEGACGIHCQAGRRLTFQRSCESLQEYAGGTFE